MKPMFEAYSQKRRQSNIDMYNQAELIALMVGTLFTKDAKIPTYEDLFESDTPEYQAKQRAQVSEQLKQFAAMANKQRRQKEDGNRRRETES